MKTMEIGLLDAGPFRRDAAVSSALDSKIRRKTGTVFSFEIRFSWIVNERNGAILL